MHADRREPQPRTQQLVARFQRESTAVRIPYRYRLLYWCYYIALAHRGVMVHSALRDAVYQDGFLKRGHDRYCEKINRLLGRAQAATAAVEVPSFAHGELESADLD